MDAHFSSLARLALACGALVLGGCSGLQIEVMQPAGPKFDTQGCVEAALRGNPDPTDLPLAVEHFRVECALRDPAACSMLGILYERGLGVEKDPARAASLFEGACQAGNESACVNLGRLHASGAGVAQQLDKAMALYAAACRSDHAAGCTELARMHAKGRGVLRDVRHAAILYQHACEEGEMEACFELGALHESGALKAETMRTILLYEKACAGGMMAACDGVGRVLSEARPIARPEEEGVRLGAAGAPRAGAVR